MEELEELYQLQCLDLALREKEEDLRRLRVPPASVKEAEDERARMEGLEKERQHLKGEVKDRELEIDTIQAKIKRLDKELLSGKGAPKELLAKQTDQQAQRDRKSALEDQELEMMERLETLDRELASARAQMVEKERLRDQDLAIKAQAQATLEGEIAQILRQREILLPQVPAAFLSYYESQRKHLLGQVLVPVVNGSCHGCGVQLAAMEMIKLRRGERLRCESCGRILLPQAPAR
jgi:predicted  nucleic acid-binding Zn-ribbon protein